MMPMMTTRNLHVAAVDPVVAALVAVVVAVAAAVAAAYCACVQTHRRRRQLSYPLHS